MGNETSFRSFPAHVHHLLTVLLAETHVVHTKLYPRYRSKRNISFARDDFSKWLEPHEDLTTDVVLLGHSMGGLLSAEVILMPASAPANRPFKHRLLGSINFDVPFLGMHPGVVKSGLASMFLPDEPQQDKWTSQSPGGDDPSSPGSSTASPLSPMSTRSDTFWQPEQQDPNFNATFNNDVVLPMRKGWSNTLHFLNKHRDNVFKATKQLVTSHMEFGGAMANYPELKARYGRVRVLEEEDENVRRSIVKSGQVPSRVRFVNYYTASTGRIKKKSPVRKLSPSANASRTSLTPSDAEDLGRGRPTASAGNVQLSRSQSPRISLEEHSDDGIVRKTPDIPDSDDEDWAEAAETLTIDDPLKRQPPDEFERPVLSPTSTMSTMTSLRTIPDLPDPPPSLDVSYIKDPATRKLVEKEHIRALKAYEKAVKDREKLIEKHDRKTRKDSDKMTKDAEKAKRKAEQAALKAKAKEAPREMTQSDGEFLRLAAERERMEAEGRRMRGEPEPQPGPEPQREREVPSATPPTSVPSPETVNEYTAAPLQPMTSTVDSTRSASPDPADLKPKKDRMFCSLPPKDSAGERDPLWVRIFMQNVDEVGAHCGLFFVDERYERLVGEVSDRIESWVREDMAGRALRRVDEKHFIEMRED